MRGQKSIARRRADRAIVLDILNLIGRFFKLGMETKQFPLETSKSDFAIVGDEVNGRYYDS